MGDPGTCEACGRRVPWGASRCTGCGAPVDAAIPAGTGGSTEGRVSVGGGRPRPVVAVALLGVVGALWWWAAAGGGGDEAAAPPDTRPPATTDDRTPPTRPPATTAPVTTSRVPTTTTAAADALPVPTALAALGVDGDRLVVLDLDSGTRLEVPLPVPPGASGDQVFVADGAVVVPLGDRLLRLGADATDPAAWTDVPPPAGWPAGGWPAATGVLASSTVDRLWVAPVGAEGYGPPVELSPWAEVVGRIGDDVVVNTPDGAYAVRGDTSATGSVRRLATGRVVGVTGELLTRVSCDERGRCTVLVGDAAIGPASWTGPMVLRASAHPDGDRAVVVTVDTSGEGRVWWMAAGADPVELGPIGSWSLPGGAGLAFGTGGDVAVWHDTTMLELRAGGPDRPGGAVAWRLPSAALVPTATLPPALRPDGSGP